MKRILIPLAVIVVLLAGGAYARKLLATNTGKDLNQYRYTEVKTDLVKKTVTATGILKPWTTVDIKSKAGGRVDRLPVDEGTIVKKGQLIAAIDPADTLLTYNSAQADIEDNHAKVDESGKNLTLQRQQILINVDNARASLKSNQAAANAAHARYESAHSQSNAQSDLTLAAVESARATLAAEQEKLNQMQSASQPQALAVAKSNLRTAQANMVNAEKQLARQKDLYVQKFVALSQVDQAQATFDVAKAAVESAQEKINTIQPEQDTDIKAEKARVRQAEAALRTAEANRVEIELRKQAALAAKADAEQADASVRQAETRLRQAEAERINVGIRQTQIAQVKAQGARAEASLVNAKSQLDQTRVTAPSAGIVLKKYVEEGTLITSGVSFNSSGTSIVQMGDISRMYVDVQVDETDVAAVDVDQKVDITFDAYNTTPFEGKVIKIDPQAVVDSNVTTVHVRVEVDNSAIAYRLLKPGLNATCEFIVKKKPDVVAVPNEALKTDNDGNHYVEIAQGGKPAPVEKGGEPDPTLLVEVTVVKRPVEIGLEGNDNTEITSGLKESERVITQTIEPTVATAGGNPFGGSRGPGRK